MSHTLKIQLTTPSPSLAHDFRNFGEEVYLAFRKECAVSIEEIDAAEEFYLREIRKREVRSITARVRKIAASYRDRLLIEVCES